VQNGLTVISLAGGSLALASYSASEGDSAPGSCGSSPSGDTSLRTRREVKCPPS
jgi:hypothetical protein